MNQTEMAQWRALQELDDHPFQDVGFVLKDLMLEVLGTLLHIIKLTDVARFKTKLVGVSESYHIHLMNVICFSACLFLQRL